LKLDFSFNRTLSYVNSYTLECSLNQKYRCLHYLNHFEISQ